MKNLFEQFANGNAEVTSKNANLDISVEFNGSIEITKGGLSQTIHFYAKTYEMLYKGYVTLDDWDVSEYTNTSFNGMPVDNLSKLKQTLADSGLETFAKSLEIDSKELEEQISIQIQSSKLFKDSYGKNMSMWIAVSADEREIATLKYAIEKYDTLSENSHVFKKYIVEVEKVEEVEDKVETSIKPPIEVLENALAELTKKK